MPKTFKGDEIDISPPETGWGSLWFSNGYKAQIDGAVEDEIRGRRVIKFLLRPYLATRKRYGITNNDLNKKGQCIKVYDREIIIRLNPYDPSRNVFFSLCDWDGKPTESTQWLKGIAQAEEIQRLRKQIRTLKGKIEALQEENYLLRSDMRQYIKENADSLLRPIVPTFRSLVGIGPAPLGRPPEGRD